jgi:phosphatidylglycerophosphate synthase
LIGPLVHTSVHPNHVTTLGLGLGLAAAVSFASTDAVTRNCAAVLYVVQMIVDHADGELARWADKTSAFGHQYDRIVDLVVKISVFVGMGIGVRDGVAGGWTILAGVAAGFAFVTIFGLRSKIARRRGNDALAQPHLGGFELEDILYLTAPVTWLGHLAPFVLAAGVGAPIFALWIAWQWVKARSGRGVRSASPEARARR